MDQTKAINPEIPPSGSGCVECLASDGWWLHLRRCGACGHVGCCDSSPSQHARHHAAEHEHWLAQSFEPGEDWYWDYSSGEFVDGPVLVPPHDYPADQPSPGPEGRVPSDWKRKLNRVQK